MITRRTFLASAAAAAGAAALPMPAIGQATRDSTLRFVPDSTLSVLDPIASNGTAPQTHGWHVYDTLYGMNNKFEPKPQMAEGHSVSSDERTWEFKLRDGLKFHDGEPVRAADCAASMARWSKRDSFGQQLDRVVDEWQSVDDKTMRIKLKTPFPKLLDAFAIPSSLPPVIMPERLAKTDPATAVTDATGSGPYKFVPEEFAAGNQAVYTKFNEYVPRSEAPEYTSGGKVVHFDRIEWRMISDVATATSALINGEVDVIDYVNNDMIPLLEGNPNVKMTIKDPAGKTPMLRLNTLQPPFNNPAVRRVVLEALDQNAYLQSLSGGRPELMQNCFAMFPCGMPMVKELGKGLMNGGNADMSSFQAKLKAAGYKGEKVAIMNPADLRDSGSIAMITADLLTKLGMNVELQTADWATIAGRRFSKEPTEKGGWSILAATWPSPNMASPAINQMTRGLGAKGPYFGWFESSDIENATKEFVFANTPESQQAAIDKVQKIAFEQAPYVPLGKFLQYTATNSTIDGYLPGLWFFPWNIRRV